MPKGLSETQKNTLRSGGYKLLAFSFTSQENGFSLWEGDKLIESGSLDIKKGKYFRTLRGIFFGVLKKIKEVKPDYVAIKQEIMLRHPGITSKNMRIVGLVMSACFLSGRIMVIEVSKEAVLHSAGLHSFTRSQNIRSILVENISKFTKKKINSFKEAEAIAVGIAANWKLKMNILGGKK